MQGEPCCEREEEVGGADKVERWGTIDERRREGGKDGKRESVSGAVQYRAGGQCSLPPLHLSSSWMQMWFLYGSFVLLLTPPERSNYNCSILSESERHAWIEKGN